MGLSADLKKEVEQILKFADNWDVRVGDKVPEPEEVGLGNKAVELDAVTLYADLEDSTALVRGYKWWFAAEIYKSYLLCACRIIQANNGTITAFDGDRVMAIFVHGNKNSDAAKAALQINYAVEKILNPLIKEMWPTTDYVLKHAVGIDNGKLRAVRTGIRKYNDLVWVGTSANYAAKLCSERQPFIASWITESVFNSLLDTSKYSNGQIMWTPYTWSETGGKIYGSSWYWEP